MSGDEVWPSIRTTLELVQLCASDQFRPASTIAVGTPWSCCAESGPGRFPVVDEPPLPRQENSARRSHRRVITVTCQSHGAAGFTNLLVTKEDGVIVLNPHVANCCVLLFEEQPARSLHSIFGEWLG